MLALLVVLDWMIVLFIVLLYYDLRHCYFPVRILLVNFDYKKFLKQSQNSSFKYAVFYLFHSAFLFVFVYLNFVAHRFAQSLSYIRS